MSLLPDGAFTRAALLIALALIATQLLVFFAVRYLIFAPAVEQMAHSLADNSRLIALLMQEAEPSKRSQQLETLTELLGLELDQTERGPRGGEPRLHYQRLFTRVISQRLGALHPQRVQMGPTPTVIWVQASHSPPVWVGLSTRELEAGAVSVLFIWVALGSALSILIGFLLARSLTSGLRRLVGVARRIGRGELPAELTSTGPREVRELSHAMGQMARAIRRSTEERNLLLAGISHDLRTPLARMRLSIDLAPEIDGDTRDSLIEDIDAIDTSVADFIASVRDEHDETVDDCDLNQLIHQTVARLGGLRHSQLRQRPSTDSGEDLRQSPRADASPRMSLRGMPDSDLNREISLDLEPLEPLPLRPRAIARVLQNLLENARRYGAAPIQVQLRRLQGRVRISVFDKGPGVAADELDRLLQPFQRGLRATSTGSGLGLATARRIIQEHGGEISLHRRPAGGLEARIELPLTDRHTQTTSVDGRA